jgi:hypothetical protein
VLVWFCACATPTQVVFASSSRFQL